MRNKDAKKMIERLTPTCDYWLAPGVPWLRQQWLQPIPLKIVHRDARILKRLRKIVSPEVYNAIQDYLEDAGDCWGFDITRDHGTGTHQDESYDYPLTPDIYIDQSVGYCGDDYYGYIWIKITPHRFFKFEFNC